MTSRSIRVFAALLVALGCSSASAPSHALDFAMKSRTEGYGHGTDEELQYSISRNDCLAADDTITFSMSGGTAGGSFQLWLFEGEGGDCDVYTNRSGGTAVCTQITAASATPSRTTFDVALDTSVIPAALTNVSSCDDSSTSNSARKVTLYFLFENGSENATNFTHFTIQVDLLGPAPPTGVTVGTSDEDSLKVTWTASSSSDVTKYKVFCELADSTAMGALIEPFGVATGGAGGTGGTGTGGTGGAGGAAGGGGAGGAAATGGGGDAGRGGDTTTAGTGGSGGGGDGTCTSASLTAGQVPSGTAKGEATGMASTSTDATGLTLGQSYACGVSAVDELENDGVLSELGCGAPEEVTDFFEYYSDFGGKGSGCNCTVAGAGQRGALGLAALAGLAIAGWWRRRSRRGGAVR